MKVGWLWVKVGEGGVGKWCGFGCKWGGQIGWFWV